MQNIPDLGIGVKSDTWRLWSKGEIEKRVVRSILRERERASAISMEGGGYGALSSNQFLGSVPVLTLISSFISLNFDYMSTAVLVCSFFDFGNFIEWLQAVVINDEKTPLTGECTKHDSIDICLIFIIDVFFHVIYLSSSSFLLNSFTSGSTHISSWNFVWYGIPPRLLFFPLWLFGWLHADGADRPAGNSWAAVFSVSSYTPYFNVDTDIVADRIISSINSFRGDFFGKIDANPDL